MAAFVERVLRAARPDVILTGDHAMPQYLPAGGRPAVPDHVCESVLQVARIRDLAGTAGRVLRKGRRRKAVRFPTGIVGA